MNLVISHFSDERLQGEDKQDENPNKDTNNESENDEEDDEEGAYDMEPKYNDDEELEIEDGKEDALTNPENESSDPIFRKIIRRFGRRVIRRFRRRNSRRRRRRFG